MSLRPSEQKESLGRAEAELERLPRKRKGRQWRRPLRSEGRETPWIDIARQLAGDRGVEALGAAAKTTPPGTDAIAADKASALTHALDQLAGR